MKSDTKMGTYVPEIGKSQISRLISGILIGYAITCIVFLGYAILITYSNVPETGITLVATITCLVAVIVAGFDSAKGALSKGWLWGIIAGFFYAIILGCIMTWVNKEFTLDSRSITLFVLSISGGGLGGVIGINFKK